MANFMKEQIEALFPGEHEEDVMRIISKLQKFMPHDKSKLEHFEILVTYLNDLLSGDMIHQYCTYEHSTPYVTLALQELSEDINKQILSQYRDKKDVLEQEVQSLSLQKEMLLSQVSSLQKMNEQLLSQKETLSLDVENQKKELNELKSNGTQRVQNEIASLQQEKEELKQALEELRHVFETYDQKVSHFCENDQVVWQKIDSEHPIYSLSANSIDNYVNSLESLYENTMGVSLEESKRILRVESSGLYTIRDLLSNHNFRISDAPTIDYIIKENWKDSSNITIAKNIGTVLSHLKLPVFKENKISDSRPTNPNIQELLRELEYNIAKQRILEQELLYVVEILKNNDGEDFDVQETIESLDLSLSNKHL